MVGASKTKTKTSANSKRILWIDDHVHSFRRLKTELEQRGYEVDVHLSEDEVDPSAYDYYDVFIFDNKLGERQLDRGIEICRDVLVQNGKKVVLFSAYLTLDQIKDQLYIEKNTGSALLYEPKKALDPEEIPEYYKGLADRIHYFIVNDEDILKERGMVTAPKKGERYTYSEFTALSLAEKAAYYEQFQLGRATQIQEAFNAGALWMFFFDGEDEPELIAYDETDILPNLQVAQRAEYRDQVPFIFRNDLRFESVGCVPVGMHRSRIATYPYIELSIAGNEVPFHFDTGCDTSLFDARFATESGAATIIEPVPESLTIVGKSHICQSIELEVVVRTAEGGIGLKVPGYAVNAWGTSNLFVQCHRECGLQPSAYKGCRFRRNGLIGRDIYTTRKMSVILSGQSNKVVVEFDE